MNTHKRSRATANEPTPELDAAAANEIATTSPITTNKRPRRITRPTLDLVQHIPSSTKQLCYLAVTNKIMFQTNTSHRTSTAANSDTQPVRSPSRTRIKRSIAMPEPFTHELEGISPKTITSGTGFLTMIMDGFVERSPELKPMIMSSDEIVSASSSSSSPPPKDSPLDIPTPDNEHSVSGSPPIGAKKTLTATAAPKASLHVQSAAQAQPVKPSLHRSAFRPAQGVDSTKDFKTDFADMGMSKKRVREVAGIKEWRTPEGKTIHKRVSPSGAAERGGREKRVKRDSIKGKGVEYEGLQLGDDPNWILFDPHHKSPSLYFSHLNYSSSNNATPGFRDPPRCFAQFETYQPGNKRILEFNVVTSSVRMKSTPKVLEGREVLYSATGPRLVNVMDVGVKKGGGRGEVSRESRGRGVQVGFEEVEEDGDLHEAVDVGEREEGEGEDELYV
ncbi:hypothetical protein LTR86_010215 [Recurvomyces mirabilis]|nr:hypothetical protein LTR86_010215 [Recurvomyces mirabilis]